MQSTSSIIDPRFRKVADTFYAQMKRFRGGGAVCIYHHGVPVIDLWTGARNWQGDPWQQDTLSVSFSTTKGVVSTLLHQQAALGLLDYDDPVAKYWPEFAAQGKEQITVRDLLTHRAGMYRMDNLNLEFDQVTDWDTVCAALAAAPADISAAPYSVYHALTYGWLVGEVARRVSGKSISDMVQEDLGAPLGLDGLFVGTPDSEHHRVADLIMGKKPGSPPSVQTLSKSIKQKISHGTQATLGAMMQVGVIPDISRFDKAVAIKRFHVQKLTTAAALRSAMPGFNGVFTARSLARLYAALANNGELDGTRILPSATVHAMSQQQVFTLDRALYTPMRWRMGYHQPFVLARRPKQGFGHFGYGGSGAWADPERGLSVALTVNAGAGTPWGDARILKIGAAALKCCS